MNPNNEKSNQNGGPPSLNSAKNVSGKDVCRDYVWGKCIRKRCNLLHTCDTETMVNILQFCHDYQNSTGCIRQNCTFLHATREEEKLFRETGQFPADLMKRHQKMNMSREDSYGNQRPPPSLQGPHAPQPGPSRSQQGPNLLMVNPVYQSPWFLLPPPPPPREPSPPPQTYPGPAVNTAASTSFTRIDTSKPPPPLPQTVKNGSIRRLPEEEGTKATQTYQSPSRPMPEMLQIEIDTTKPPPRLPSTKSNTEKRGISDPYVGPSKTRKIETESSTCENCLQWDLRKLEIERKKKDKLKEKAILVLQYEEKKKELMDIVDTLKGLYNDPNHESYDMAAMDLLFSLNDPDIRLQRTKNIGGADFLSNSQIPKSQTRNSIDNPGSSSSKDSIRNGQGSTNGLTASAGEAPRGFVPSSAVSTQSHSTPLPPPFSGSTSGTRSNVVPTYSHPPPIPPPFTMGQQNYRPANSQFNPYMPGPSNVEFNPQVSNSAIPPSPALPPYDHNMYYNMMGRPPPPFT